MAISRTVGKTVRRSETKLDPEAVDVDDDDPISRAAEATRIEGRVGTGDGDDADARAHGAWSDCGFGRVAPASTISTVGFGRFWASFGPTSTISTESADRLGGGACDPEQRVGARPAHLRRQPQLDDVTPAFTFSRQVCRPFFFAVKRSP